MKIGFIGNANNYPFMIARAMRKMGHEVLFIVDRDKSEPLNRPENRYDDIGPPILHGFMMQAHYTYGLTRGHRSNGNRL